MHVCVCVSCNMCLTQWRAVCDQNVCVVWDLVPLIQQSLTSRQVEAPAVVPGLPAHTQEKTETSCFVLQPPTGVANLLVLQFYINDTEHWS